MTTSNICGSDLHLYGPLTPFMGKGNILGHENMGRVPLTIGEWLPDTPPGPATRR